MKKEPTSGFVRGLTPTIQVSLPVDLSNIDACELWIDLTSRPDGRIVHGQNDLNIKSTNGGAVVSYKLTEEESLKLRGPEILIQIRWKYPDGTIAGTSIAPVHIDSALWNEAMK